MGKPKPPAIPVLQAHDAVRSSVPPDPISNPLRSPVRLLLLRPLGISLVNPLRSVVLFAVVFGALGLVLSFIPIINNSVFVTPRAEMREKPFSFMECSALLY